MPRLIVLNGPPGCGKSTLAQMYVPTVDGDVTLAYRDFVNHLDR